MLCPIFVHLRSMFGATNCIQMPNYCKKIKTLTNCEISARSTHLNSTQTPLNHAVVLRGKEIGLSLFGSPTLSDQAQMPFPSVKIGAGNSARSHTADEFIYLEEIRDAIRIYIELLDGLEI